MAQWVEVTINSSWEGKMHVLSKEAVEMLLSKPSMVPPPNSRKLRLLISLGGKMIEWW